MDKLIKEEIADFHEDKEAIRYELDRQKELYAKEILGNLGQKIQDCKNNPPRLTKQDKAYIRKLKWNNFKQTVRQFFYGKQDDIWYLD